MSGMSSAIFVYSLVIGAILLAGGFFAVILFVIRAVNACVMSFAIFVSGLVVCAILSAAGLPTVVFFVVGAVNAGMAGSVMPALMMAVGVSGAAGGGHQQACSDQ